MTREPKPNVPGRRLDRLAAHLGWTMVLAVFGLTPSIRADDRFNCSVLFTGGQRDNVIYSYDAQTRTLIPYSNRIADALDNALGNNSVVVQSLSYGLDGTDYEVPHGLLLYSLSALDDPHDTVGIYDSAVFREPVQDSRADLYGVPHVPSVTPELNIKVAEENSAQHPPVSDQYLPTPLLGIAGGVTGQPQSASPPDLLGFDYHLPSDAREIYFTVDQVIQPGGSGPLFYPSDILCIDEAGTISSWATHQDLGLEPTDKIDALSACFVSSQYLGQDRNILFSLTPDSPSVGTLQIAGPSGPHVVGSADVLHYIEGDNAATLWRNERANGLRFAAASTDTLVNIDEVTSIDPRRFSPNAPWETVTPFNVEVGDIDHLQIDYPPASGAVIEWNFEMGPLNSDGEYYPSQEIRSGDSGLVLVHYLDDDGYPRTHRQMLGLPGYSDPPADALSIVSMTVDELQLELENLDVSIDHEWEIAVDGVFKTLVPIGVTTFSIPIPNAGSHVVSAHALHAGNHDLRSDGLYRSVYVPSTVPTPTNLSVERIAPDRYQITWESNGYPTRLAFLGGGGNQTSTVPGGLSGGTSGGVTVGTGIPITGTPVFTNDSPYITPSLPLPYYRVAIRAESNGEQSAPVEASFFNGAAQTLVDWRTIPSEDATVPLEIEPGDLALVDSTATLIALDRSVNGRFAKIVTLDHDDSETAITLGELPSSALGVSLGTVTGVAAYSEALTLPDGSTVVKELLAWATLDQSQVRLWITSSDSDVMTVYNTVDVAFAAGTPTTLGGLTHDGARFLLSVDGRLHEVAGGGFLTSTTSRAAAPIESLSGVEVPCVASREYKFYDVPGSVDPSGNVASLLTLDSYNRLVTPTSTAGSEFPIHGMVAATDPLATYYVSHENLIGVYKVPNVIDVGNEPIALGLPGDTDGDGISWTLQDLRYVDLLQTMAVRAPVRFEAEWEALCKKNWDINEDGVANADDLAAFVALYPTSTESSTCIEIALGLDCATPPVGCP